MDICIYIWIWRTLHTHVDARIDMCVYICMHMTHTICIYIYNFMHMTHTYWFTNRYVCIYMHMTHTICVCIQVYETHYIHISIHKSIYVYICIWRTLYVYIYTCIYDAHYINIWNIFTCRYVYMSACKCTNSYGVAMFNRLLNYRSLLQKNHVKETIFCKRDP